MPLPALEDTIAAIATAPGESGLAVVRVSGREALACAARVFDGAPLEAALGHTLHHGWARWPAEGAARRLDEVVAAVFRAPRSYTREDVVEFSCHGGLLPARRLLAALLASGARLASPGEFTLRAFLSGRLDLAQAEAVADLIHAETERAADLALAQLAGALSQRLHAITEQVRDALAETEARVDFAEDVGGIEVPAHVREAIAAAAVQLETMLAGSAFARAVREGVHVPLLGRPNAGKSSLFNALLGEARAIVTDVPGTTRDRVSESLELAGVRVTLSDTAGVREASDAIEAEGVERAWASLASAACAVWVVDGASPLGPDDRALAARLGRARGIVALNKSDLPHMVCEADVRAMWPGALAVVAVCATQPAGVEPLREALAAQLGGEAGASLAGAVANARHAEALSRAAAALRRAGAAAHDGAPGEIVALELREALAAAGEVTGDTLGEDLLDRIFGRFCIGK